MVKCVRGIAVWRDHHAIRGRSPAAEGAKNENEDDGKENAEKDRARVSENGLETGSRDGPERPGLAVWSWRRPQRYRYEPRALNR